MARPQQIETTFRECRDCGLQFGENNYAPINSIMMPDHLMPICNTCLDRMIANADSEWVIVNKLCQFADIPFIPDQWEKVKEFGEKRAFYRYACLFREEGYESVDWTEYNERYAALVEAGTIDYELPLLGEAKMKELHNKWGPNYDREELSYLEDLYNGVLATQNVNGKLQTDQAKKVCKISLEIDSRIRAGGEIDKLLTSYDRLVKVAEFTPKNAKNINDFDTFGEAAKWLEKNGWKNKFFDNVTRDIVDETIKNFENFNRRLYVNESNIGDEITNRLQALKSATEMEQQSYYGIDTVHDLDEYDHAGYHSLIDDDDDFNATLEE